MVQWLVWIVEPELLNRATSQSIAGQYACPSVDYSACRRTDFQWLGQDSLRRVAAGLSRRIDPPEPGGSAALRRRLPRRPGNLGAADAR
jgi:hypothetical protein